MTLDISILSIVLISMGSSTVLGVLSGLAFRKIPHRLNDIVLGFAAGVMLAAAMLGLMAPAFEESGGFLAPLLGTFAGALIISLRVIIVQKLLAGISF